MEKVGIPKGLFYYYYKDLWKYFFEYLDISCIYSEKTNKKLLEEGSFYASDEMCISMKCYLGHIASLKGKVDTILVPRIDNYGMREQTCTNFLSCVDLVSNLFPFKVLYYNIDLENKKGEEKAFISLSKFINRSKRECKKAYQIAKIKEKKLHKSEYLKELTKLKSDKIKILIISHPYNTYDAYFGKTILSLFEKYSVELIYADKLQPDDMRKHSYLLSKELYWKYSRELIGAISYTKDCIDGILFLSSFPCGLDSLVNELVLRRISIPSLQLILDDMDAKAGFETRIESFMDILEGREIYENR